MILLAAGIGMALSLPPLGLWPLAFLAPVIPAHMLDKEPSLAALIGATFGLGLFAVHLAWLGQIFHGWYGWLFALPVVTLTILLPLVAHSI